MGSRDTRQELAGAAGHVCEISGVATRVGGHGGVLLAAPAEEVCTWVDPIGHQHCGMWYTFAIQTTKQNLHTKSCVLLFCQKAFVCLNLCGQL
jgi:hypothetical protein